MLASQHSSVILVLGTCLALAKIPGAMAQQPLPPAEHAVSTGTQFGDGETQRRSVPMSLHSDWTGQWGDHFYSVQATAETFGGLRPMAAVQAHASTPDYWQFYGGASALVQYYVRLRARAAPPPGNYPVPILANARGESQGRAYATVQFNYGVPLRAETYDNTVRSFDVYVPFEISPNDPDSNLIFVELKASALGYTHHASYPDSAQAYADPFFTFDQAAFDLYQTVNGGIVFQLADYFEFEYSEYLINPPAPPVITIHPQSQTFCEGGTVMFSAAASSTAPLTYQWRRDGSDLYDDENYSGATAQLLTISPALAVLSGSYDCVITNPAGSVTTNAATLAICPPDFNCDAAVDFFDYLDFVAAFSGGESGADFNADTTIDFFDYLDFVAEFSTGC